MKPTNAGCSCTALFGAALGFAPAVPELPVPLLAPPLVLLAGLLAAAGLSFGIATRSFLQILFYRFTSSGAAASVAVKQRDPDYWRLVRARAATRLLAAAHYEKRLSIPAS